MKTIPYTYCMLMLGIAVAIYYLSRVLLDLIRKRKHKLFIALTAALLAVVVCYGSPFLLDLPNVLTGQLATATGRVVAHDSAGREDVSDSRAIIIETASGEQIRLQTIDTPIHMDEYLQIAYLPHCHIGYIVERITE